MRVIIKSIQSGKYRQKNNTWTFDKESARVFFSGERDLDWYRKYPTYYEMIEVH